MNDTEMEQMEAEVDADMKLCDKLSIRAKWSIVLMVLSLVAILCSQYQLSMFLSAGVLSIHGWNLIHLMMMKGRSDTRRLKVLNELKKYDQS